MYPEVEPCMGSILHLLFIGVAANLDNLGVGIAYGIRRIKIPLLSNLVIAAIAFLFTLVSGWAGAYIGLFLGQYTANFIGAVLLIGVGVWVIMTHFRTPSERTRQVPQAEMERMPSVLTVCQEPEQADFDGSGEISLRESLVLGAALSLNCLANGLTAGLWRLNAVAAAFITAVFSFLTLGLGASFGVNYAARWLGAKATIFAGCLLILLGVHQLM
jgi:putative sporulation protein YtaF